MKTTLTSTELTQIYGRYIEPVELAKFIGIAICESITSETNLKLRSEVNDYSSPDDG